MSYDEVKNTFLGATKNKNKDFFYKYLLYNNSFNRFQKDAITKDANNSFVIIHFPLMVNKSIYGTNQNYVKALINSIKLSSKNNNYKVIKLLFAKFEQIEEELKTDEIKENLKIMKRYIYPKINQGDEWKQIAVQIELKLKSLE